uniref:Mediator of RNA polymerase II transcription subunit 1 n=1 Tax=Kwoniella pini CBS 10737 TaxID=1296096 RepID=A0A1B9I4C8_9TREE|nr:uncharacterized protein I206_03693 [Kwoniella pini CBS 10737]OCF50372.1 hypothetical protein I206_03693 [Kwoniella pini CBS 10737]
MEQSIAGPSSTTNIPISTFQSSITPSSIIPPSLPTILESLNNLLINQQNRNLSLTHLNPYVSNQERKGKSKDERQIINNLKESISNLRYILNESNDIEEQNRLIRGLKEISNHQNNLLSILPNFQPNLSSSSSSSSSSLNEKSISFPSNLLLLNPIELLEKISLEIKLQCFIEDSQFGLMKSSLAIAGNKFVCDVDLIDNISYSQNQQEEEEEDDDDDNLEDENMNNINKNNNIKKSIENQNLTNSEKIKLSKISFNHITFSENTEKSEYITFILKFLIEDYLNIFYNDQIDNWKKQNVLENLKSGLKELKELDEYTTEQGKDGFEELEKIVKVMEEFKTNESQSKIYNTKSLSIFPTFHLLPPTSSSSEEQSNNPIIKIRPPNPGEKVPSPTFDEEGNEDVNMDNNDLGIKDWIIEIEDELIVRRNFLNQEIELKDTLNGIKIENLLYLPYQSSPIITSSLNQQIQMFPYSSNFIHSSNFNQNGNSRDKDNETQGNMIEQRWSMVQPGPTAFVIGRIGIPSTQLELSKILNSIRNQIILNKLFKSIFKVDHLVPDQLNQEEEDDEDQTNLDDLLSSM